MNAAIALYEQTGAGRQPGCRAVAGYLFGIAGELAVKEMMRSSGIHPRQVNDRQDDPFFAHFPKLKTLLRLASGRRAGELRGISGNDSLFQNWDIVMRYAPTRDVQPEWVDRWKAHASSLVQQMETPGL
jgi:hypothetical protein